MAAAAAAVGASVMGRDAIGWSWRGRCEASPHPHPCDLHVTKGPGIPELPRASKGARERYVLDPDSFPGYEDFSGWRNIIRWRRNAGPMPKIDQSMLDSELPVLQPNLHDLLSPPHDSMQVTWIGHSTVLAQFDGWNVLTDPIFSERCSPFQWMGPKRIRRVPLAVDQLPPIHVVLISHNHYDHLDLPSVKALSQQFPSSLWLVPLGMKSWFDDLKVSNVVELDWSEEVFVEDRRDPSRERLRLVAIPCQHWCARGVLDRNKCLWSSWYSTTGRSSLFFAGDTGFSPMFARAGRLLGPVDVALLPIGAYGGEDESWFHRPNHMDPEEAVQAHEDLSSRQSVAIHWGTFQLTSEPVLQPKERLMAALRGRGRGQEEFLCLHPGQTIRARRHE